MLRRIILLLVVTVCFLITACQSDKNIAKEIEKNLNAIVNNEKVMTSSNPNEYIQQNQNSYQEIINKGNDGLSYLTTELKKSKQNGLKEWLMANACEDLLKNKNPVKEWSTGKEWITKYEESK